MSSNITTPIRGSLVLLLIALLVSGCSSSSESNPGGSQPDVDVSGSIENTLTSDNGASGSISEMEDATIDDATSGTQAEFTEGENESTSDMFEPSIPDPVVQNFTRVEFSITVPAYQSNSLQVRLSWDTKEFNASWVGDEFWAVSGEFPTETQELLAVTFFDNNGAIELASFSQQFRTGSNGTEAFQISADQFDAEQFDDDGDGVSNLDELIAGTDPTIDEDSLLEIRDSFSLSDNSRVSVSTRFEGRLSDERPFFDTVERIPVPGGYPGTLFRNIDIDADGNGTLTFNESLLGTRLEFAGTRTNSGNAIAWEGTLYDYDGDYTLRVSFTNTITLLDDSTRSFIEESEGSHVGTYQSRWNINSSLTGRLIEESSLCEPVSGMVSINQWGNSSGMASTNVTTVSKEIDDLYWRVVSVRSESEISEYFVRELRGFEDFICDYVDI